jgi:uncharacterized protein (TIGR04255 family)
MIDSTVTSKRYQYANSPLQEAIFEMRFLNENEDSILQNRFFDKISDKFPEIKEIKNNPNNIQGSSLQAWNEYNDRCIQIGPGMISLNDTSYVNFENFSSNLKTLVDAYFDLKSTSVIQRIGYRCINRFFIMQDNMLLSEYFCFGFMVPNILANVNSFGFNMTKEIIFHDISFTIIFKFYSDFLRENERGAAFILDLDVFTTQDIGSEKETVLNIASDCHELEKVIFENLILDKTRIIMGAKEV